MSERLTLEEAAPEAQFIQGAAREKARERGTHTPERGDYELASSVLDAAKYDDRAHYERLLHLGEAANETQGVDPQLRDAFVCILNEAVEPVLDSLPERADEIKLNVLRHKLEGKDGELARKEEIDRAVKQYLAQVISRTDSALNDSPQFKELGHDSETVAKLKRYHLGPETQATWKEYVAKVLGRLTE